MKTKSQMTDNEDIIDVWWLLNRVWVSWTNIANWYITEDYRYDLAWMEWAITYDKMRKSDAQVFATQLACELPIRATKWYIEPACNEDEETDDKAKEIAKFVENNLFNRLSETWDDTLREILTMLPFGYSVFEKTYKSDWKNIYLTSLWSRKATTIQKWIMENWKPWITQLVPWTVDDATKASSISNSISIPAGKLVIFSFRKEGKNYEWCSILRSAYKHRYIKDKLYKFDSVRHERQSVWIPIVYLPKGATATDKAEALKIVRNIRSTEQTGIVMPWPKDEGWLFEFADTKASSSTDLFESIKHHNREIAKNILAQFLELWDTASWSRALSEDQSDLFLLSLWTVAKQIADTFNKFIIPELVNLNYDIWEMEYPKLKFGKLWDVDYSKVATYLSTLAGAWILTADEDLEIHIREMLDLPKRNEEDMEDMEELDNIESEIDDEMETEDTEEQEIVTTDSIMTEMFASVDSDTKAKISEALKKYRASKGRKDNQTLDNEKNQSKSKVEWIRSELQSKMQWVKSAIAEAKLIKNKAARKQKMKEIRDNWKKIKTELRATQKSEKEKIKKANQDKKKNKSDVSKVVSGLRQATKSTAENQEIVTNESQNNELFYDDNYFRELSNMIDNEYLKKLQAA